MVILKWYTSKKIIKAIQDSPKETRKENLIFTFRNPAEKATNVKDFQFWRHDNQPIELWRNQMIFQNINYIHQNHVKECYVTRAEYYRYNSAVE